jgi:hypothetical protein
MSHPGNSCPAESRIYVTGRQASRCTNWRFVRRIMARCQRFHDTGNHFFHVARMAPVPRRFSTTVFPVVSSRADRGAVRRAADGNHAASSLARGSTPLPRENLSSAAHCLRAVKPPDGDEDLTAGASGTRTARFASSTASARICTRCTRTVRPTLRRSVLHQGLGRPQRPHPDVGRRRPRRPRLPLESRANPGEA